MSLPAEYASTRFRSPEPAENFPASFAIITAWNPLNQLASDSENHHADGLLFLEAIPLSASPLISVCGSSPDGSHVEDGWAIEIPLDTAIDLGRRFRQLAIWWVHDDTLHLVDCSTEQSTEIGRFSARLHSAET